MVRTDDLPSFAKRSQRLEERQRDGLTKSPASGEGEGEGETSGVSNEHACSSEEEGDDAYAVATLERAKSILRFVQRNCTDDAATYCLTRRATGPARPSGVAREERREREPDPPSANPQTYSSKSRKPSSSKSLLSLSLSLSRKTRDHPALWTRARAFVRKRRAALRVGQDSHSLAYRRL